jgi:hypothetical protein
MTHLPDAVWRQLSEQAGNGTGQGTWACQAFCQEISLRQ